MRIIGPINRHRQHGFTLIEVILSLVVCGILAAMISVYVGNSLTRSSTPGNNLRDTLDIYSVMERIRLDYDNILGLNLATLKTDIGATGTDQSNGYGTYHVVSNEYITYNDITPKPTSTPTGVTLLMVTISDQEQKGINVSSLFTE